MLTKEDIIVLVKNYIPNAFILLLSILVIKLFYAEIKMQRNPPSKVEAEEIEKLGNNEESVKKRYYNLKQLSEYDGVKNSKVLLSIKRKIYDVTASATNYGPEGSYSIFSGKEIALALANSSLDSKDIPSPDGKVPPIENLNQVQMDILDDWIEFFDRKYNDVGILVDNDDPKAGTIIE